MGVLNSYDFIIMYPETGCQEIHVSVYKEGGKAI